MKKSRLKVASDEQAPDVLIKQEVELLAQDTDAPDLANQELDKELLRSMKTEHDPYHMDAEIHAVPGFTPVPQTEEYIKIELMLDEELIDNVNDSETNCAQHVLPLDDDPLVSAITSDKKWETGDRTAHSDAPVKLRRGPKPRAKCEQEWKCEFCLRAFKKKSDLNRHLQTHAESKAYIVCEICGSSFTQHGSLKKHMRRKHSDKAESTIPGPQTAAKYSADTRQILKDAQTEQAKFDCGISSRSFKNLKLHLETHSKDRKREFSCDLCDKKFYTKTLLWCHKKVHTRNSYTCTVCSRSFKTKCILKVHLETHSKDRKRELACDLCEKKFYSKKLLWCHKKVHTRNSFTCTVCSRSYKNKSSLKVHLKTHAKVRKREFACDSCDKRFYCKSALWCHKKVHTLNLYTCKVCGHHFRQEKSLKAHMLRREHYDETQQITPQTSNDDGVPMKTELISDEEFIDEGTERDSVSNAERSHQPALAFDDDPRAKFAVTCEICQNSYPVELIETHKRITHGDKSYKCELCPRVCPNKSTFEKHLRTHKDNRPRPYACEQCGSKFLTAIYLKRHISTQHTRNRIPKFNCKFCEKKFYSPSGLTYHTRIHTGETLGCEVCGARFLRDQGLQQHILSKHAGKTQQFTLDSQAANDNSFPAKEEYI